MYLLKLINLNNLILYGILIFYNSQYTIYHKYFDPLLMIVFLLLFKLDRKYINNNRFVSINYICLYIFLIVTNLLKNYI